MPKRWQEQHELGHPSRSRTSGVSGWIQIELIAIDGSMATLRTSDGKLQTFRRRPADPLGTAERLVIWELTA